MSFHTSNGQIPRREDIRRRNYSISGAGPNSRPERTESGEGMTGLPRRGSRAKFAGEQEGAVENDLLAERGGDEVEVPAKRREYEAVELSADGS